MGTEWTSDDHICGFCGTVGYPIVPAQDGVTGICPTCTAGVLLAYTKSGTMPDVIQGVIDSYRNGDDAA